MDADWEDAIQRGDIERVRDRLDRGADLDARDRYGQTALMLAAHAGHRAVVEILIAHGANLNTTAKYGLTALMLAIVAGHADVAGLLADAGTDLGLRGTGAPGFAGKTAYDLAVERGMDALSAALEPRPEGRRGAREIRTVRSEAERCKEAETFRKIHAAFRDGDLAALRAAVEDPECVPNGPMPLAIALP